MSQTTQCSACREMVEIVPVETGMHVFKLGDAKCPLPRCGEGQPLPRKKGAAKAVVA